MRRSNCLALFLASILFGLTALLGQVDAQGREQAVAGGSISPSGVEVMVDLPVPLRIRNTVGVDGLGLCVWASAQMMANDLNVDELADLFQWMQTQRGGGWPERVDEVMAARAPARIYKQSMGRDLGFIEEGVRSGRPVCITYGYGEIYGGRISHMVVCVHLDERIAAVIDNNEPEVTRWMSRAELQRRFTATSGYGWAWYVLGSPPPPVPHN